MPGPTGVLVVLAIPRLRVLILNGDHGRVHGRAISVLVTCAIAAAYEAVKLRAEIAQADFPGRSATVAYDVAQRDTHTRYARNRLPIVAQAMQERRTFRRRDSSALSDTNSHRRRAVVGWAMSGGFDAIEGQRGVWSCVPKA